MAIILMVIGILFLICCISMVIDGNRFVIREYTIQSDKIEKECKAAVISDLHNKQYGKDNEKLLKAIDGIAPDFCLLTGDILTARPGKSFDVAAKFTQTLARKYPVYYGIGNHEYRLKRYPETYGESYPEYTDCLKQAGVQILENESILIKENNIRVTGAMIDRNYYRRLHTEKMEPEYLNHTLGQADEHCFQILLAHNPDYFPEYAKWGANLVLSGHVHGGVMRLPFLGGVISPKCTLFPKYDGGMFREGKSVMVLSRGLGMHTIPVRIFNPGELIVIHLLPCK
ncbi:MAG: metallophosphoesterase [Lachnospiraceae bacterium]|nr:metallophosphoesterase [Lachnospiraceae bacterium]